MFPRRWRSAGILLPLAGVFFCFAPAHAKDNVVPVHVEFRALQGCPEGAFLDRLLARSAHIRAAQPNEVAPLVVARVTRGAHGARGQLVVRDVDGTQSQREVLGDTCESVFNALVLMSAIALDPSLATQAQGATAADDGGTTASPADASGGTLPSGAASGASAVDASPTAATDRATTAREESSSRDAAREDVRPSDSSPPIDRRPGLHTALGGGAGVESGAAPRALLTWTGYVELTRNSESTLSPVVRFAFEHANSGDQPVTGGGVRFVRNLGVLDVCLRWAAGPLRLLPCFEVEGGALGASGEDLTPARNDTRTWLALGALARARYVAISPFFLELDAGLRLPLVRDRFFFEPDNTVFRAPVLSGFGGGTIGLSIL